MSRQHHYLKTEPMFFQESILEIKPFEVRFNDRNYKVHDMLYLQEWLGGYTGREAKFEVTCVLDCPRFCKEGFVIMGIRKVGDEHIVPGLRTIGTGGVR